MKLSLRQTAAIGIAGFGDFVDLLIIGAVPGIGEPFDFAISVINSFLLKDPKPMIGLIEVASLAPPMAVLDFLPVHSLVAYWTIREQNKKH